MSRPKPVIACVAIDSRRRFCDAIRDGGIVNREAIDVESFVIESWFGLHYVFEYAYRCTEYEYDFEALHTGDQREVSQFMTFCVCDAVDPESDSHGKSNLKRIVSMLTRLIQRTQSVSDGSIEYEYEYRDADYEYENTEPLL